MQENSNNKKKRYIPKKQFPAYQLNPFLENSIKTIVEKTTKKMQFIKPITNKNDDNKGIFHSVMNDETGEFIGHSAFVRFIEVDEDKFAKLYLNELGLLWDMNKSQLKVFSYILHILKSNEDKVFINMNKAKLYTGYKSNSDIINALSNLILSNVLAKSDDENIYFINPMFFFNGSRVTFAKTYIKKTKNQDIINQPLSLFPIENMPQNNSEN